VKDEEKDVDCLVKGEEKDVDCLVKGKKKDVDCLVKGKKKDVDCLEDEKEDGELDIPLMNKGNDRDLLVKDMREDDTLEHCRELAERCERGYKWEDGLLIHTETDKVLGSVSRIVVPKSRRLDVIRIAHDGSGHMSFRKVVEIVRKRFVWPCMREEIRKFCTSCFECQRVNKAGSRRVPMIERPVISEPFDCMAFDLVGPLPKAKGGVRFLLTSICMASRWPEAIPLRTITAKVVAEGMIEIFSRTGIPSQILSDQGAQFMSSLVKELCLLLSIDRVRTTAYHPQSNGMLERMHGTLEAMLAKAHSKGLDWSRQVPFALFALRQVPSRSTGFSPYRWLVRQ